MKKLFIALCFLLISTFAFADTFYIFKPEGWIVLKNMHLVLSVKHDNEYHYESSGLYYQIDGVKYFTTMYEIKFN